MTRIFSTNAWAIKHWRRGLYKETVRATRREAIKSFKKQFGVSDKEWRRYCGGGVHRAVRVAVATVQVS